MPSFLDNLWYGRGTLWQRLLTAPLALASGAYWIGLHLDQWQKARHRRTLPRPVVSVGNLTLGGTGKTPFTLWLAQQVMDLGAIPCILSRGYGSARTDSRKVPPDSRDYPCYGDEPLLMARSLPGTPVYVGKDRWQSGLLALESEPKIDLFLLDDGFQHRRLARDLDIVLFDGERQAGNGHLFPWGPLREPLSTLSRADIVGVTCRANSPQHSEATAFPIALPDPPRNPPFRLTFAPVGWRGLGETGHQPLETLPRDRPAWLLSGIASPQGFEQTVAGCGLQIAGHSAFRDHHPFSETEVRGQLELARRRGARLVTTAKDAIRLEKHSAHWTPEEVPIMIELGLIHGDGLEPLTRAVKRLLARERDPRG